MSERLEPSPELPPEKQEMLQAVENHELFFAKKPMNEFRTYMGLPPTTSEDVASRMDSVRAEIAEIARKQRESW